MAECPECGTEMTEEGRGLLDRVCDRCGYCEYAGNLGTSKGIGDNQ